MSTPPSTPAESLAAETLWTRLRPWLPTALLVLVVAMVLVALRALFKEVDYADVLTAVRTTPLSAVGLSLLATVVSYVALAGYDWSALRYVGARVPRGTLALASFIGYALGNTVGLGALTGGAVRYRIYSAAGLDSGQIGRVVLFIVTAFGLGLTVVAAVALLWGAPQVSADAHLPVWALRSIAALILLAAAGFIALCAARREVGVFRRWNLRLPGPGLALAQLLFSAIDVIAAAAALWFLLPGDRGDFATFVAIYAIAIALGVLSHVPGGLGVFEAVILLVYGPHEPLEAVAGALLLYRAVYYLVPLFLAMLLMAFYELRDTGARVGRAVGALSPLFLSVWTMIVGIMLLVSGVTPATDDATELLSLKVPLEVVEASHFIGSIAGLAFLFIARGLLNRLDAAWWAALILTVISFWLALPKGLAIGEMTVLAFLSLTLIAGRREFDRRASLFSQLFTPAWLLMVGAVIAAVAWLLFFVYRDVDYDDQLWWQFAFNAHAPRSLRALLAVSVAALAVALWHWFRPAAGTPPHPASEEEIARAERVLRAQPRADACLALLGDKTLMFSESGNAFLMYGKRARTWVSLYDPVGSERERAELVWDFIEMAAEHGGRAVFYQVRPQNLSLYVDTGLSPFKLGESAQVRLPEFSTKGSANAHLRQAVSKGEREGLSFEIIAPSDVAALMPELRRISDGWLAQHNTREKSFSLGSFQPHYLQRLPIALLRRAGQPVAFASLQCTDLRAEASIDLMRYAPDAPKGTMDYLFVKLMLHFQAEGYAEFGLGMAPFSGLLQHKLAPRWHRLGSLVFDLGENFYNFHGLRAFKEKFNPVWEPRYLCSPGGLNPLLALADIAALSSGGLKGVIGK